MGSHNLSDGFPICSDYTAAAVVRNPSRLREIRTAIETMDAKETTLTKESLSSTLVSETEADRELSSAEFTAVMACLANTQAATESRTTSKGYSDYTFTVIPDDAVRVLDQQIIASMSSPFLNTRLH